MPSPPPAKAVEARPAGPILLADVLRSIDATHPLLDAARVDARLAEAEIRGADGGFDPSIRARGSYVPEGPFETRRVDVTVEQPTPFLGATVFGGWRYGEGDFAVYDGKAETLDAGEARAGISVPLWRNAPIDRRRADVARAEAARPLAEASIEERRLRLHRDGAFRYWDWIAAARRLLLAEEILDVAKRRDAVVRLRASSGDLARLEAVESRRAILQREQQVISARRALEAAAFELSQLLRDGRGDPVVLDVRRVPPTPFPRGPAGALPSAEADEARALESRPEPRRIAAALAREGVERDLAENQLAPAVDVQVVGSRDLGDGDRKKLGGNDIEASFLVDLPLFRRRQEGRLSAVEATIERLRAEGRAIEDRIVADVRDARSALSAAERRVETAREELLAASELVRIERQRFDLGESDLLVLHLREQAELEAAQREVEAQADRQKALAARAVALGEVEALR